MNDTKYCAYPEYSDCSHCEFAHIECDVDCWGFPTDFFEVTCFCIKSDVEKLRPDLLNDVENNDRLEDIEK